MPVYVPGSLGPSTVTNKSRTTVATAAPYAVVGGAPWTPDQASGLQLWLKADSIAQADGTAVSSWADSSGSGNTAVAGTAPTFKTNILNGLPVVRFNGTSSWLSSSLSAANKPVTIAAVVKVTSSGAGEAIAGAMAGGGSEYRIAPSGQQDLLSQYVVDIGNGSTSVGTTAFNVLRVTYDASGNYAFFLNGVADGSGLNNQTFSATTRIIGANASGGGIEYLPGDLAEYVEYNTALSTADGAALDNYLYQKWLTTAGPVAYFASLVATSLTVPNIQKAAAKTLAVVALTVPALRKAISKTLVVDAAFFWAFGSVVSTTIASVQKAAGKGLSANSTSAVSMTKAISKILSATSTTASSVRKAVAKILAATSTTVPTLATFKALAAVAYYATLAATSTTIASIKKAAGKGLSATTTTVPSIRKAISKTLAATSTSVPALQKAISKGLSATSTSAPALQKAIAKTLSAVSLSVPTLVPVKDVIVIIHLALGKLISASGAGILRSRSGIGNLITRAGTGAIKTRSGLGWLISRSGLGNLRSK